MYEIENDNSTLIIFLLTTGIRLLEAGKKLPLNHGLSSFLTIGIWTSPLLLETFFYTPFLGHGNFVYQLISLILLQL